MSRRLNLTQELLEGANERTLGVRDAFMDVLCDLKRINRKLSTEVIKLGKQAESGNTTANEGIIKAEETIEALSEIKTSIDGMGSILKDILGELKIQNGVNK